MVRPIDRCPLPAVAPRRQSRVSCALTASCARLRSCQRRRLRPTQGMSAADIQPDRGKQARRRQFSGETSNTNPVQLRKALLQHIISMRGNDVEAWCAKESALQIRLLVKDRDSKSISKRHFKPFFHGSDSPKRLFKTLHTDSPPNGGVYVASRRTELECRDAPRDTPRK